MIKYTFTFEYDAERAFREVLGRLDESEYNIVEDIHPVTPKEGENIRYVDRTAIIEMEPEAASTFRFRLGNSLKIRRERTEAELAEEKALHDANTVTIRVIVPKNDDSATTP